MWELMLIYYFKKNDISMQILLIGMTQLILNIKDMKSNKNRTTNFSISLWK